MNRQVVDLGFILKQFPDFKFSVEDFDGRLRLQKFIYLMQIFDIYLGYDFSWYLRGPYCSTLAASGFALEQIYHKIPNDKVKFSSAVIQKRFDKFRNFIKKRNNDNDFLEIAASIHYLQKICTLNDDEIIAKVVKKQPRFTEDKVRTIYEELKKWPLI